MRNHKILVTTIKVLITLIPIYFIIKNIDLNTTFELIAGIGLPYLVCAICVVLLEMLVMTQRWKIVLDSISIEINYKDIISIFWIGLFLVKYYPQVLEVMPYGVIIFTEEVLVLLKLLKAYSSIESLA